MLAFFVWKKARDLLSSTNFSLEEIAERCGFGDYGYFCRYFKKIAGMPAGRYRKKAFQNEKGSLGEPRF